MKILGHTLSNQEIDEAKELLKDSDATREILLVVTLLRVLAVETNDHASDLVADGFTLRAEEADNRSIKYANAAAAICRSWTGSWP